MLVSIQHWADFGWTALHWAASHGTEAVARLLLEMGADIAAKND
jgi:ankyrin repeat protein